VVELPIVLSACDGVGDITVIVWYSTAILLLNRSTVGDIIISVR